MIKRDNKEQIEAWLKENKLKKLRAGEAQGAPAPGTSCAAEFGARALGQATASATNKKNYIQKLEIKRKNRKFRKAKLAKKNMKKAKYVNAPREDLGQALSRSLDRELKRRISRDE